MLRGLTGTSMAGGDHAPVVIRRNIPVDLLVFVAPSVLYHLGRNRGSMSRDESSESSRLEPGHPDWPLCSTADSRRPIVVASL